MLVENKFMATIAATLLAAVVAGTATNWVKVVLQNYVKCAYTSSVVGLFVKNQVIILIIL